jgi:hypothetical protein
MKKNGTRSTGRIPLDAFSGVLQSSTGGVTLAKVTSCHLTACVSIYIIIKSSVNISEIFYHSPFSFSLGLLLM